LIRQDSKLVEYNCNKCEKKYNSYNGLKKHIISNKCKECNLDICDKIKNKYPIKNVSNKINNKYSKQSIPHTLKRLVWNFWIGEDHGTSKCLCCNLTKISQMNFVCGHIIAEINGGKLIPNNLKPICQSCNSSIGTKNMNDFIKKYGF
jgi:hypothetical protein